ncbi:phage portal protein [Kribbella solani]|uniref:phage portal protein n=1 Tax=Kribbella solani TaxID=236067 RepID=UPI0029B553CE|nr:phage portal protein [Kribbella solani]MDX3006732.1 phage portal protein [Kribbella solani]
MRWPWQRDRSEPTDLISISDPALASYFGVPQTYAGVQVGEGSVLGISAFWRAVMLIAGTVAGLPMKTYRDTAEGERQRLASWLDNPGGVEGQTPYEWKETALLHLLLHGDAFLKHIFNQGGAIIGAIPIHPLSVSVEWEKDANGRYTGRKLYRATLDTGAVRTFTQAELTQVMGPSLDGLRGLSILGVARNSLGTTIAGDRAASRMFGNGALISGLVTPEEDITEEEATAIKAGLDQKLGGWENAGSVALVNRKLKFTPWTMSAEDAQFLQSRQFQIEEIARWTGVPPHLLMQTEKQTSWGTGVESQNRGLSRFTLSTWTSRFEQRLSLLLPPPVFVEFDYAGLERPTPEQEIDLLIKQVDAGLITPNEARHIRNLPRIDGGDELRVKGAPPALPAELPAGQSEEVPA